MEKCDRKIFILWILVIIVNIKSIFVDFGDDQAYAVAMSFRHLMGDGMLQEMWEPHQTSSFLVDFLMILYRQVVPNFECVALYLQICGVLLYAVVCRCLYKELVQYVEQKLAHYMCIFFFVFRVKQSVFPEFSNMQICFSVLIFIYLSRYLIGKRKRDYRCLICAAFFLCLEVLAYPTCALLYVGIVLLLYFQDEKRWRSIGIFTGVCAICGAGYLAVFVSKLGVNRLLKNIQYMIQADASHSGNGIDFRYYFRGFAVSVFWVAVVALISYLCCIMLKRKGAFDGYYGLGLLITEVVMIFISREGKLDWGYQYLIIMPILVGMGIWGSRYLDADRKYVYYIGLMISSCSMLSVMLLTNLEFLSTLGYLVLGATLSFLPIKEGMCKMVLRERIADKLLASILLLFLFHRAMVVCGYASESGIKLTVDVENIIRMGPAKGIVASLEKCNEVKGTLSDWEMYADGQSVLVVVPWMLDSMVYVDTDSRISAYSTIDTPTYNENLLAYWEAYPEKMPTVIAVEGWNGEITLDKNAWIFKWIEENYPIYGNGQYWRFYMKE